MEPTANHTVADDQLSDDQHEFENYLPGMPTPSTEPGRFEWFVTRLFRRRGGLRRVVRSRY